MQVINLGCGMDTRPWRLNSPAGLHVSWVDIDTQEMIDLKRKLIHEEVRMKKKSRGGPAAAFVLRASLATRMLKLQLIVSLHASDEE